MDADGGTAKKGAFCSGENFGDIPAHGAPCSRRAKIIFRLLTLKTTAY